MTQSKRDRRGFRVAGLPAVLLAVTGLAACGTEPGSRSCTETAIAVADVTVTDRVAPLTLTATMTAGGKPVQGAELAFFIAVGPVDGKTTGRRVAEETTDADGVATHERPDGVDGLLVGDRKIDRYSVEFNPINKIDGVQYCRARGDAALTVT
ncbi:hypothetical protein [Saccharothrix deserti]|uniref:hypothetical protein n=1 Tax=Saccharothrix deserti TaxID=2593674 RepID=UPI00131B81EE|nr:hypothetical protein [Saccharothrix deserti]